MNTHPILFSSEMVRALLDGRKTQTRRILDAKAADKMDFLSGSGTYQSEDYPNDQTPVSIVWGESEYDDGNKVKPQWLVYMDEYPEEGVETLGTGYGNIGDLLWVREAWAARLDQDHLSPSELPKGTVGYWADGPEKCCNTGCAGAAGRERRSFHMPRWASRITLKITNICVERVQDIDERDVRAEGVELRDFSLFGADTEGRRKIAATHFKFLWDSINAERGYSWDANPWVWAITFQVIRKNVDQVLSRAA